MYGQLICDESRLNPNLHFQWATFFCESAPDATGVANNMRLVDALLQEQGPALSPAERVRVRNALQELLPWLSDCGGGMFDFMLRVALQHHMLLTIARTEREDRINAILISYFGPEAQWNPAQATVLRGIRRTAVVTPDPLLPNHLRSVCGSKLCVWALARSQQKPSALTKSEIDDRNALYMAALAVPGRRPEVHQTFEGLYYHALPAERGQRVQRLQRMAKSPYSIRILEYVTAVSAVDIGAPLVAQLDALWEALTALEAWMDQPDRDPKTDPSTDLIECAIVRMKTHHIAAQRQAQAITLSALQQGVNLGAVGRRSLQASQALDDWILRLSAQSTQAMLGALGPTMGAAAPQSLTLTLEQPLSQAPEVARAWRTKRSLEIYKGPVARRRTPAQQPVNRSAARKQLQERAQKVRKPVSATPTAIAEAWTDQNVDELLHDTLIQSAQFYLAEINDLIDRAKELHTPDTAVHACAGIAELLVAILKSEANDELEARDAFAQADEAMGALRRQVTNTEAEGRLRARFDQCLTLAISRESMVHGKRHGGVIAQPLSPTDWSWVDARYHRRWLSGISHYTTEDGIVTALPDHCALALHVTAKSMSGYAFDISVHLWWRLPTASTPPSTSTEPYPPINQDDWYDSFIPCAVLHIPHAT